MPYVGGAVAGSVAGMSAEQREIRHLTFGSGRTTVLLWSQMHGNESAASMALADIIRFFHEQADHPLARRIAAGATIHMIPLLNPDGAERFQRRNAQGIDVNRDARRLQTPEGKILKAVRDAVNPDFGFNLHDQSPGIRVGRSARGVAIALLAPAYNEARDVNATRRRAMQVASVLVGALRPLVGDHIAKYDDTFNPRAFGDLMATWGSSTVLIESGGWADDPQKQHLRKANFVGILAALESIATGAYAAHDPGTYEALEFNGRRLPDMLVTGGTVVVAGRPPLLADLLVSYDDPLLPSGGRIDDIGDLAGVEALDTLRAEGLYVIPGRKALDAAGGMNVGVPATFLVAAAADGRAIGYAFDEHPVTVVPVHGEPRHRLVYDDNRFRILDIEIPPGDTTLFHTHARPILYVGIGASVTNSQPFGDRWGTVTDTLPRLAVGRVTMTLGYQAQPLTHRVATVGSGVFRLIAVQHERRGSGASSTLPGTLESENEWFRVSRLVLDGARPTVDLTTRNPVVAVQVTDGQAGIRRAGGAAALGSPGRWAVVDADRTVTLTGGSGPVTLVLIEVR